MDTRWTGDGRAKDVRKTGDERAMPNDVRATGVRWTGNGDGRAMDERWTCDEPARTPVLTGRRPSQLRRKPCDATVTHELYGHAAASRHCEKRNGPTQSKEGLLRDRIDDRAMSGRRMSDGRTMDDRWSGDERAMDERWTRNGRAMDVRWTRNRRVMDV